MPELRFAITQQQKSVLTGSIHGPLTQPSIQTPSQTLSGWMTKPALPIWRLGGTHRSRHWKRMDNASLTHSFLHSHM